MKTAHVFLTAAVSLLAMGSIATAQSGRTPGLLASRKTTAAVQVTSVTRRQPLLFTQRGGGGACECAEPACGCQPSCAAPPVCGCESPCETKPACGCEPTCAAPPACGCDSTGGSCCCSCRTPLKVLLGRMDTIMDRLFACHSCCEAPACDCEEPACGCEAPACGCDVAVGCGCQAPAVYEKTKTFPFDEVPGARSPKTLPDPFLDDEPPPAPPVPTETRRGTPRSRHAGTQHVSKQFFAAQVQAGKDTPRTSATPTLAPVVEARSVLRANHEQSAPTTRRAEGVAPATLLSPVPSSERASKKATRDASQQSAPTLIIPVNPLR